MTSLTVLSPKGIHLFMDNQNNELTLNEPRGIDPEDKIKQIERCA